MPIYRLGEHTPKIHPTVWIAPDAQIIGNVTIEANASIWFNVTIRADRERIIIGENSNIQDGSVLHADAGIPLIIGKNVTVGHLAMLHGCEIRDGAMVGIRATVLNGAIVGENSLIAAGALIGERKTVNPNSLMIGAPARFARTLDEKSIRRINYATDFYIKNREFFTNELEKISD